jgi:glutathione S-transferase
LSDAHRIGSRKRRQEHGHGTLSARHWQQELVELELKAWLAMKRFDVPFEEINIRLRRPDSKEQLLKYCPSGLVPTLLNGDLAIWDSFAILEPDRFT